MTVVLVTGGFGSLGTAIAARAEQAGATAVRTGRHRGPDGLEHDVTDPAGWRLAVSPSQRRTTSYSW